MIRDNGTDLQMRLAEIMGRSDTCKRCGSKDLEFLDARTGYDSNHIPIACEQEYICKSCSAHGLIHWDMVFKYNVVPKPWNK